MFCKKKETSEWVFTEEEKEAIWNFVKDRDFFSLLREQNRDLCKKMEELTELKERRIKILEDKVEILTKFLSESIASVVKLRRE